MKALIVFALATFPACAGADVASRACAETVSYIHEMNELLDPSLELEARLDGQALVRRQYSADRSLLEIVMGPHVTETFADEDMNPSKLLSEQHVCVVLHSRDHVELTLRAMRVASNLLAACRSDFEGS